MNTEREQQFIDAKYDLDHPESASALPSGTARNTAFIQNWLNFCPAVRAWKEIDEETIIFNYDSSVEVSQVPDGVEF
jgi:ferredoxin-like protein FixX